MLEPAGDITGIAIPWVFHALCQEQWTGTAFFAQEAAVMQVVFNAGEVRFALANFDDDTLGEFLVLGGRITRALLHKALAQVEQSGKRLIAVLLEWEVITPQDLVSLVRFQAEQNILNLFSWERGRYWFREGVLAEKDMVELELDTAGLILEGIRNADEETISRSLPPLDTILRLSPDSSLINDSDLLPDELNAKSLINGMRSIQEICTLSNRDSVTTLKSVYILLALQAAEEGILEIQPNEVEPGELAEEFSEDLPIEPVHAMGTGISEIPASESQEQLRTEIQKPESVPTSFTERVKIEIVENAYDSLDIQDYYEMLGVGRRTSSEEIQKAYKGLIELYDPAQYQNPEENDTHEKLEILTESLNDAYAILSDHEKRNEYNMDLVSGIRKYEHVKTERQMDTAREQETLAEEKFQEGMLHYRVKNFWGAEEAFRSAARLNAEKADYAYYEALALCHMPRRSHEAEDHFKKALSLSPKIEYHLELAAFYLKNGSKAKALTVYRDALRIHPTSDKIKQAVKKVTG
ncbi:MAG: DUF4388 domain-containing protein [Nitrospirota bacterium]